MSQAELPVLRVAYMPLIDCAPLVAASRLGLDHAYGLQLQLHRQASWAGVRDRLLAGEADAAHTLASLVYAIDLGVGGPQCPMALLMTLNHNGQAVTLAPALAQAVAAGQSLPQVLAEAGRRVVFAQTFPTGTHALWLYYWLAACGVDPMRDVDVVSIPPPQMPEALASGLVDGYCSGEPWAAVAEAQGSGQRVIRSGALARASRKSAGVPARVCRAAAGTERTPDRLRAGGVPLAGCRARQSRAVRAVAGRP